MASVLGQDSSVWHKQGIFWCFQSHWNSNGWPFSCTFLGGTSKQLYVTPLIICSCSPESFGFFYSPPGRERGRMVRWVAGTQKQSCMILKWDFWRHQLGLHDKRLHCCNVCQSITKLLFSRHCSAALLTNSNTDHTGIPIARWAYWFSTSEWIIMVTFHPYLLVSEVTSWKV